MSIVVDHEEKALSFTKSAWSGQTLFDETVLRFYPTGRDYYSAAVSISEVDRFTAALREAADGAELDVPADHVEQCSCRFKPCVLCNKRIWPIVHDGIAIEVMNGTATMGRQPRQYYHRSCGATLADRLDNYLAEHTGALIGDAL